MGITDGGVCVVAGEASGDAQAALLVRELTPLLLNSFGMSTLPKNFFWGVSGPLLRELGVEAVVKTEDIAVMGIYEIITQYHHLSSVYKRVLLEIKRRKPIFIILVDYPGFNLRLAEDLTILGFKVIYHIPPKVWSHGLARVEKLKKYTSLVTCILPFEEVFFKKHAVNAKFIGNPLFDEVNRYFARVHLASRGVNAGSKSSSAVTAESKSFRIGLLPGSRKLEIERVLPVMIEAFVLLRKEFPNIIAQVPVAQTLPLSFVKNVFEKTCQKLKINSEHLSQSIHFLEGQTYDVISSSDYACVCSGTAVLETAFFQVPMCAVYKLNSITAWLARRLLKIKYVTLVNLCLDKEVIPEFLQENATASNLALHAKEMLTNSVKKNEMISEFKKICELFPENAARCAANAMIEVIL